MSNKVQPTGTQRFGRWTAAAMALATVSTGILAIDARPASAANGGRVMCANQAAVVGVWVQVSGGVSGWAGRSGSGYEQGWSYNTQGRSYKLTVGCGGTPARWASSSSTPSYSTTWSNVTCYPGWVYGGASYYVHDRCFAG